MEFSHFFSCQNTLWFGLKRTCNAIYSWFGGEKRVCEFQRSAPVIYPKSSVVELGAQIHSWAGARKLSWGPCWNTPSHHNNCHFNAWFLSFGPFQSRTQHLKNEGARKTCNFYIFFFMSKYSMIWTKTHLQRHLQLIWRRKTSVRVSHVPTL